MNKFNSDEFNCLCKRFNNSSPFIKDVTIKYEDEYFFNKVQKVIEKDRRGEVVFCVIRPDNTIITVTSEEYPKGIFRIPTGGINYSEDIVDAVLRETREELGIDAEIIGFAGVIRIRFEYSDLNEMFYSYLFILKEISGRLLLDASDDEISEVKLVDLEELDEIVNKLNSIEGEWRDWGKFRHVTSNAILEYLKANRYI
ncbi:MAG: NUDIX hydrolase [Bacillota bacterium]